MTRRRRRQETARKVGRAEVLIIRKVGSHSSQVFFLTPCVHMLCSAPVSISSLHLHDEFLYEDWILSYNEVGFEFVSTTTIHRN